MAQYNAELQAHAATMAAQGAPTGDAVTPGGPLLKVPEDPASRGAGGATTIKYESSPDSEFQVRLDTGNGTTPRPAIKPEPGTTTATASTIKREAGPGPTPGEGGFIPSDHPDAPLEPKMPRMKPPKIFYATRTHSQIAQVVKELKRSGFTPRMAVLASKQHYCVNSHARAQTSLEEACEDLLKDSKCDYFKGTAVMLHSETTRQVHDIEDLCKAGKRNKGCPYYLSRRLAEDAELVFGPYNYLVDPVIRRSIGVEIEDAIIIFDEAHNIEDVAREAASLDLERLAVMEAHGALVRAAQYNGKPSVYTPLCDLMATMLKWMEEREKDAIAAAGRSHNMNRGGYGRNSAYAARNEPPYERLWAGASMLQELVTLGLGPDRIEALWEAYTLAREEDEALATGDRGGGGGAGVEAPGAENRVNSGAVPAGSATKAIRMGPGALGTVSRLIQVVRMLHEVSDDGGRDFRLVVKRVHATAAGGDVRVRARLLVASSTESGSPHQLPDHLVTFSLWCLNPAVAFRQVATPAHSIILTSGTLSPLDSFASELGSPFQVRLEAPHVVNMARQVWAGALGAGPSGEHLLATYQHTSEPPFQDAVGSTVLQACRTIPDGVLLFLPSYSLLDKLVARWKVTGLWSRLAQLKVLVQEPRSGGADALQAVMKEYYSAIATGRGGLFIAVCRGKVSEGLDFADANARGVLVVGIPFPNVKDTKVEAKRKFNDIGARTLGLLSGSVWYEQQAFRALNQAVGRCIRHRGDWGAIILVDERFQQARYQKGLSRWVRGAIGAHPTFQAAATSMEGFFARLKADPPAAPVKLVQDPVPVYELEDITLPKTDAIAMLMAGHKAINNNSGAGGKDKRVQGTRLPPLINEDIADSWGQKQREAEAQNLETPAPAQPLEPQQNLENLGHQAYPSPAPQQHLQQHPPNSLYYLVRRAPLHRIVPAEFESYIAFAKSQGYAQDEHHARFLARDAIVEAFDMTLQAMHLPNPLHEWLLKSKIPPPWGVQAVLAMVPYQLPPQATPLHMEAVSFAVTCLSHMPAVDALLAMKEAYEEMLGYLLNGQVIPQHTQQMQYQQGGGVKRKLESDGHSTGGQQNLQWGAGGGPGGTLIGAAAAARQAVLEQALGTASTDFSDNSE